VTRDYSPTEEEKVNQLIDRIRQLEAEVARLQEQLIGMWGDA